MTGPAAEPVEVVDRHGTVLRVVPRSVMRRDRLRHRSVFVAVISSSGQLLVHQRSPEKDIFASYWDIACGLVMLISRYVPIIAPIALAASLAAKKPTPFTAGTLRTDTVTFGLLLMGTVLLLGALTFLPAAVLGPVAEHLGPIPFGG